MDDKTADRKWRSWRGQQDEPYLEGWLMRAGDPGERQWKKEMGEQRPDGSDQKSTNGMKNVFVNLQIISNLLKCLNHYSILDDNFFIFF